MKSSELRSLLRQNADLALAASLVILALLAGLGDAAPPAWLAAIRNVTGILLVLVLPGYALTSALFPGPAPRLAERVALSLGLSLAVVALGGLLLNLLPGGLSARPWRLALAVLILAAAGVAAWRRSGDRRTEPSILPAAPVPQQNVRVTLRDAVLLSMAVLVLGVTLGLGIGSGTTDIRSAEPFTQFWALPGEAAAGRPQAGDGRVLRVGLQNFEGRTMTYRVEVVAGDVVLAEWPALQVADGAEWQMQLTIPPAAVEVGLEAVLHRSGSAEPYRRVHVAPEG